MKLSKLIAVSMLSAMVLTSCQTTETPPADSQPPATETKSENDTSSEQPEAENNSDGLVAEDGAIIKFSYWEGSPSDEAAWKVVLDKFRADHPEITLEAEAYPSSTYVSQIDTMIAGNSWPDVLRYTYQRLGKFKEAEVMLELDGMVSDETINDLLPAYKSALTYNGKLVGMPHHTDTIAVFYNKEMFEASGIRIPENEYDGWTWDELTEIAKKLKADHSLENVFAGIWENKNAYRFLPFVYMNGGTLLNDDGTELAIDSPEFLEAIKLYESWRKDELVTRTGFTQDNQANSMFAAKQLAFVFAGSWHGSFMDENMPGNWGVTYMPQVDGKTGSDLGGNGLFAYKGTKYPKASAIFIDYITNKENMKLFCETGNFIPVLDSLSKEELNFDKFKDEMKVFMNIASTVDPRMAQDETSSKFQDLNIIFGEQMDFLIINGTPAEDVIESMKSEMQYVLEE